MTSTGTGRASAHTPTPVTEQLGHAITTWSNSMCRIVLLAARFAESREWVVLGSPSAAHWVAEVADIEVCTAREWIRVGRRLQGLPGTAEAFGDERVSYSKVRTLTRVATSETEGELLALAEATPAGHLARAIAAWATEKSDDEELARLQHKGRSLTWRHAPDGLVTFTMRLVPEVAGRLIAEVSTRVMRTTTKASGQLAWPSLAQQQADAFGAWLAEGGGETEVVRATRSVIAPLRRRRREFAVGRQPLAQTQRTGRRWAFVT